jgi:hypothetical protein
MFILGLQNRYKRDVLKIMLRNPSEVLLRDCNKYVLNNRIPRNNEFFYINGDMK